MGRLLALAAALMLGALMAWAFQQPPRPRAADAPAAAFSAGRAMTDVRVIGAAPHPVGSPANRRVRDHLLARMAALGLDPQLRPGQAFERGRAGGETALNGASVENLLGVLPGRDRTGPAVLLMAHYDSVAASPGAADDAAGVAAVLEVVRAIKARGAPARDVMVLLSDGEEAGLVGARAFFASDPLARHAGFVLNLEARGSAGRAQMFQTGAGNGATIDLFRRTAVRPSAQALAAFIYDLMPNDTDFTVSRNAGLPGLNYAFIGGQFDYHSASATPVALDQGTLQDLGGQVLAAAAGAAFAPRLPTPAPDLVYGSLFGDMLAAYPPATGWLLLAAAAALLLVAARRVRRVERFGWTEPLRGAGAALYAVAATVGVLHAARQAAGVGAGFLEQRALLAQAGRWEATLTLLAVGVLLFAAAEAARGRRGRAILLPVGMAIASCLFARGLDALAALAAGTATLLALASFGRAVSRPGAWAGVLTLGLAIGVAVQAAAPPAAYVIAWPLLAATAAAAATALGVRKGHAALAALAVVAAVSLAWIGGLAHLAYLSLDLPELLAAPVLLAAFPLWPLAQPDEGAPPARRLGPALMALGAVLLLVVRFADPYDARHPRLTYVAYHLDQDARQAWRISLAPETSAWTTAALTADGGAIGERRHWLFDTPFKAAPARLTTEPPPAITLDALARGRLRLHAEPIAGSRVLALRLKADTPMILTSVNGAPAQVRMPPGRWTRVRWEGPSPGLDLILAPAGPGRLELRYASIRESWPAGVAPLPQRPADAMPFGLSDSTLVTGSRKLAW